MTIALNPVARAAFSAYKQRIAQLNGVESVAEAFAVAPNPAQKTVEQYQELAEFLKMINIVLVDDGHGQKLGMGVNTSIASTTDTRVQPRRPVVVGDMVGLDEYHCTQTNYDVAYLYALLNAWSTQPDFQVRLAKMVNKAIALDKLRMGWNGIERSPTSDRTAYPMLQDVKKGWLQKIREQAPQRVYSGNDVNGSRKLLIGADQEFRTLDGLIESAIEDLVDEQFRDSGLVAICGRGILSDKYLPLMNQALSPSEIIAARNVYANKQLGTLPALHVPFFPRNTILITKPENLSIYIQRGTLRRYLKDEPEWDRTTDYQSVNEDFVVEDYGQVALLENIEVTD